MNRREEKSKRVGEEGVDWAPKAFRNALRNPKPVSYPDLEAIADNIKLALFKGEVGAESSRVGFPGQRGVVSGEIGETDWDLVGVLVWCL